MSDLPTPPGIVEDDWAATPLAVRVLVTSLLDRVARLEERVAQTSRTSSKPPSSDPPSVPPRPPRRPSGRKTGGQPGHEGHGRTLLTIEQVDAIVDVKPEVCVGCGGALSGEDPHPARHQVADLPRVVPEVTEYRRHMLTCAACGTATTASWPAEMSPGCVGPRTQATVAYLTGRQGVSHRDVQEVLATLFHLELSLGSIAAVEQQVSAAVAEPVAEAHVFVQTQPVTNVDETGWREGTQRRWLWVAVTAAVSVFVLQASRGSHGAKALLGALYGGIVGSDRWSGYAWLDASRRQLCWAHLLRDFAAFVERGGEPARIGQGLLEAAGEMFALWYRVRDGTMSRADFQQQMRPVQRQVRDLLGQGAQVAHDKTRHASENILKLEGALWTFVTVEGVEPTNNAAERALRRAVLWRRRSFGTQSTAGSCFVARLLTVVTTLRQQERDVLDYLTDACAARIRGAPPPSLLPCVPSSSARPVPVAA